MAASGSAPDAAADADDTRARGRRRDDRWYIIFVVVALVGDYYYYVTMLWGPTCNWRGVTTAWSLDFCRAVSRPLWLLALLICGGTDLTHSTRSDRPTNLLNLNSRMNRIRWRTLEPTCSDPFSIALRACWCASPEQAQFGYTSSFLPRLRQGIPSSPFHSSTNQII